MNTTIESFGTNMKIIGGVVKGVYDGTGKAAGKVATVILEGRDYDYEAHKEITSKYKVSFWNSEKDEDISGEKKKNQRRDYLMAANVKAGSFITINCAVNEKKENDGVQEIDAVGFSFNYEGMSQVDNEGFISTVIIGRVQKAKMSDDKKYFRFAIPLKQMDGSTKWINVTVANTQKQSGRVDRASKSIFNNNPIILRCSEVKEDEYNGKKTYSCLCNDWMCGPKKKKETSEASEKPSEESTPDGYMPAEEDIPFN